jgi:hypothetical protein
VNLISLSFATKLELNCLIFITACPLQQKVNIIDRHFVCDIRNNAHLLIIQNIMCCVVANNLVFVLYQLRAEYSLFPGLYQSCAYNGTEEITSSQILCQFKFISRL